METIFLGGCLFVQCVCPGCHDEIITMQAFDAVRPPRDRDFPPFRHYGGMVIFCLSNFSDLIREFKSLGKIFKGKNPHQTLDPSLFNHLPPWYQRLELPDFDLR